MLESLSRGEVDKLVVTNQLLNDENQRLHHKLLEQRRELARLRGEDERQAEIALLEELGAEPPGAATSPDHSEPATKPRKAPQRGHGPTPQPEAEQIDIVHELTFAGRKCQVCKEHTLEEMGDQAEVSEEITVEMTRVIKLRHIRRKYRCSCNGNVVTAPGPTKLIRGGRSSLDFAVNTTVSKMVDHLPLHRQSKIFSRQGVKITPQTLWDQQRALAEVLEPTWKALRQPILQGPMLHADETGFLLVEGKKKRKLTLWSLSNPELAWYTLARKNYSAGEEILGDYTGIVVADGYKVYEQLSRDGPLRLAHCWAHVLRKFRDAEKHRPVECGQILTLIGKLYDAERKALELTAASSGDLTVLAAQRDQVHREVLENIKNWMRSQTGLRRSDFGKAVRYMMGRWKGLTLFLNEPLLPLDNNAAERALRGPVVGRKNYLQFRSRRGCEAGAILYSLCETAKLQGIDPAVYLRAAALRAIEEPGCVTLPSEL